MLSMKLQLAQDSSLSFLKIQVSLWF